MKVVIGSASSLRDKAILQAAYDLALRVREVCLLERAWFDYGSRTMKVLRLKRRGVRESVLPVHYPQALNLEKQSNPIETDVGKAFSNSVEELSSFI